ncbi:hypothetical protein [Streptomyces sp. NPDC002602]
MGIHVGPNSNCPKRTVLVREITTAGWGSGDGIFTALPWRTRA